MNTRRTASNQDGGSTPSRRAKKTSSTRRSYISKGEKPGSSDASGSERVRGVWRSPRTRKKVEESSKGKGRGVGEGDVSNSETEEGGPGEEGDAVEESARDDVSEVDSVQKNISVGEGKEREDPVAPASERVVRRGDKEERQRKDLDRESKPRVKKKGRGGLRIKPRPPDRVPLVTSSPEPRNFFFPNKGDPPIKYETGKFARQFSVFSTEPGETGKLELGESYGPGGGTGIYSISGGRVKKSASEKLAIRNLSEATNSGGKGKLSKKEARLVAGVDGIFERLLKNTPKPRRRCDRCRDEGLPPEVCDFKFPCARCKLSGVKCTLNDVSPFSTRQELEQFQAPNGKKIVTLVGGRAEGEWDDFDFTLEAIPIRGRIDPGPGVYVPTEKEKGRDTSLRWCRWVVSSVGFFPPRGRPGIAQLAGIEPGDELTGVWVCPEVRVEAGCMGRVWITKELCRLAEWSRSRGRGMPQRESFISDEHTEWEFPWKLEFCRCEGAGIGDTGGCEQEEEAMESSMPLSVSPQGIKRERPLSSDNAFLRFRIFRESGYEKDGGRVFTVRVTEESEGPDIIDLADGPSSDATPPPHIESTFEVIRLLGLPPETNDMVRQRVDPRDDYDKERFFGGAGRGGVGGHMQLEGEEKVVLPMILDGPGGSNGHRHLLTGLAPPAVRLLKERVFAMARMQYAYLYGLCPPASSAEVVSEPAPEPAPFVYIDCGVASNGGSSVKAAAARRASEGRGFVKSEGVCRVSLEGVGAEQLGPGKPGSVVAGMGERQGGGERSVFVEDGDVGIGSQEEGGGEVMVYGQVSRGFNVAGGKGKGRSESRTQREGGEKERDIAIAVSNRPGSGALTAKLREAIRSEGFLSWVRELRRRSRTLATGRDGGWAYWDGDGKGKGRDAPEEEEGLVVQEGVGMLATVDGVATPCRNPLRFAVGFMPVVRLDLEAATEGKLTVANDDCMYPAVFESVAEAVANKALHVKEVNIEAFFQSAAAAATSKRDYRNAKRLQKTLRLTVEEAATRLLLRHTRCEMEKACNSAILKGGNWILTEASFSATVCRSLNDLSFDAATVAAGVSRHTKRALPKLMFRSQPTWAEVADAAAKAGAICVLCMSPLAFKCECSYGLLALRRKYWAERTLLVPREGSDVAVDIGIPSLFPNTRPVYRGDISYHRWHKGQYTCRYDQSISLHHRGLQRFPLHSKITSWKPADLDEALRPLKRSREPPDEGDASSSAAEDISPSLPRLEKWPGFPSPATAFAPAAPSENPKGMMPPSPRLLRYIHQMASMKVHGMPHEIYGSLDASALIAVGVIVEEMLEELISPLVDGRTKGYKHLTPESLARELAFSNRTKNGAGLDQAPVPPVPQSDAAVAPLSKKRRLASAEISKLEEAAGAAAVPAMDSPELRALCRVYGARAPEVVCAWKKIEQNR